MFPGYAEWVRDEASDAQVDWIRTALRQMDKWKQHKVKASQELLYALFLSPYIHARAGGLAVNRPELPSHEILPEALQGIQQELVGRILIPKRILFRIYDLLRAQDRFTDRRSPDRILRFVHRPYFRDALALYKLDLLAKGENQTELIAAWTRDFAKAPPVQDRPHAERQPRRRRRR